MKEPKPTIDHVLLSVLIPLPSHLASCFLTYMYKPNIFNPLNDFVTIILIEKRFHASDSTLFYSVS